MDNNFQVHAKLLARAATGPRSGDNQNKSRAEQGRAEQVSRGTPRCSKAIQNLLKLAIMYVFSGGESLDSLWLYICTGNSAEGRTEFVYFIRCDPKMKQNSPLSVLHS